MSYTVIWLKSAQDDLATIWMSATNRDAVTRAAQAIDRQLEIDPAAAGESRSGNDRIVMESPLVVFVEVLDASRRVHVMHVRRMPSH
jgi:hypothetical protein